MLDRRARDARAEARRRPGYGAPPMADAHEESTTEPTPCSPCRGTGTVISNLGGTEHTLPCPWCEGTGLDIPGHDAQAARRGADEPAAVRPETD